VPQKVEEAARSIGKSERGKCELPQWMDVGKQLPGGKWIMEPGPT
jgi:hypothetical protein